MLTLRSNITRTTQLIDKTNQMTLPTRRMKEVRLSKWADQDNHIHWTFRLVVIFGDSDLTGFPV